MSFVYLLCQKTSRAPKNSIQIKQFIWWLMNKYDGDNLCLKESIQMKSSKDLQLLIVWSLRRERERYCNLYQFAVTRRADLQFVSFLLHFLDQVDEHVCLRQVLWGQRRLLLNSSEEHFTHPRLINWTRFSPGMTKNQKLLSSWKSAEHKNKHNIHKDPTIYHRRKTTHKK